jgi:methionine-rich copper-binding protein CopC
MRKVIISIVCAMTIFSGCEKIVFRNSSDPITPTDTTPPTITLTDPANNATGVALTKQIAITFSEAMDSTTINSSTVTLKQGTTPVVGTVRYKSGIATFSLLSSLTPNVVYTATVTTGAKDMAGNALVSNYTFSFTTTSTPDTTPPTVTSTDPANSATGVSVTKVVTVNFSKGMTASTLTSSTFTLKQGTTSVTGAVAVLGTAATFTPSASLTPNSVYTGTITTGAKDLSGNAISANYTFSFTTGAAADLTPPTVVSTTPANNATGIATSQVISVTFSEAMTASTINTSTFTLKKGTSAVSGTVTYSGTTATFTPSAALTVSTVYTVSISTGAKDLAGNAMTVSSTWNFTTTGPPPLSFAADVIPVLNMCENCHRHGWSPSSTASTYYNNLVSRGYVKPTSYTSSTIYNKLQNGHPGSGSISTANTDKIINWMIQGSLNN